MTARAIRALPEAVINQIAAGEVIERPASIVKELVENALDAGAGRIDVEIDDGGIARIQVRDDGVGIPREELALALTRHCTSKITSADDLPRLVTLGFRGEALAAIAAVADTSLVSRTAEAVHGWHIAAVPGAIAAAPAPQPHPRGTTVLVRDLFARVPARRRFLKRAQTEALHVQTLMKRLAFCTPGVTFNLQIDGTRSLQAPAASDPQQATRRLRALFGTEFAEAAIYVDSTLGEVRVSGWIAGPAHAHAQADLQMFAVNGRVIRDRHLLHAVRTAFDDRLPAGRHACFALHLEMSPTAVDVNVHPGKLEVRFQDLRVVHDVVHAVAREALTTPAPTQYAMTWPAAPAPRAAESLGGEAPRPPLAPAPRPRMVAAVSGNDAAPQSASAEVLEVVAGRYVITGQPTGLRVLDLVGLVETTLLRRFAVDAVVKPLLIPVRLDCPDSASLRDIEARLLAAGLDTTPLGERVLALRALPVALPALDAPAFAAALVAGLHAARTAPVLEVLAAAAARALEVPPPAARAAWLARLRAAAREAGLEPAAHERALGAPELDALFVAPAR